MYPTPRSHRPLIMGRNGAVGANHPMAAQAGLDILRAGGNAVDAAVAISLALGVCEPMMSGLGGDGFYHLFMAKSGRAEVFNGTGPAPQAATPERYGRRHPADRPVEHFGARLARRGVSRCMRPMAASLGPISSCPPSRSRAKALRQHIPFAISPSRTRLALPPMSEAASGSSGMSSPGLIRQPELARTLEEIAAEGAQAFYRGRLAARLARGLGEAGALIGESDLAAFEAEVQAPIGVTYRGFEIRQTPPNSTGFVLLEMLKIVERFDVAALSPAERVHLLVEAKKHAFRDREAHGSDPAFREGARRASLVRSADRRACRRDRPRACSRHASRNGDRRRRHHLLLRHRCARQRRLGHPEPQLRLRLRRHGRRHRRAHEQPHGLLASRHPAMRTASRRASACATR